MEEVNDREETKERQGKNSADSGKKRTRQVKVARQKMHNNRTKNSILKMTQMGSCMVGDRVEEWKNVCNSAFLRSLAALSLSLSLFHIFLCFQYFSSHFSPFIAAAAVSALGSMQYNTALNVRENGEYECAKRGNKTATGQERKNDCKEGGGRSTDSLPHRCWTGDTGL